MYNLILTEKKKVWLCPGHSDEVCIIFHPLLFLQYVPKRCEIGTLNVYR